MTNDWTDRMRAGDAETLRRAAVDRDKRARADRIEQELHRDVAGTGRTPAGFYDAMAAFLKLRERVFPTLPADPVWKILTLLAQSDDDNGRTTITGLSYGAEVPLSSTLRYLAVMEAEGLIERLRNPRDARQVVIRLTDEGRRRMETLADSWTMRLAAAIVPLSLLTAWGIA